MMKTLTEEARRIPLVRETDVIVAGGGIAGAAAAIAASRTGAKVILLEKEGALGGLATLGLIVPFLPLCDGYGRQVIGGLAEELLKRSLHYGNIPSHGSEGRIPDCWQREATRAERAKHRYRVNYDAAPMMLVLGDILREHGVELWYDTRVCAAVCEDDRVQAVIVENKSGRLALSAKAFIDATGDADLCERAGEETAFWDENRLSAWHFTADADGSVRLHTVTDPLQGPCVPGHRFYRGDTGRDVSAYIADMQQEIERHLRPGQVPFLIPTVPLVRMSRRLVGSETMTEADLGAWREDAVGLTGDWRHPAPVYTFGLAHLRGVRNKNLFTAGRCISSAGDAWDVTRVIPGCAVTGQASGTAAAMLVLTGKLDTPTLQEKLKADGVILDKRLTGPVPENP